MVRPFANLFSVCVSHSVASSAGCCIFVKNAIGIEIESVMSSDNGRLVLCDFSFSGGKFRVMCIYAPNPVNDRNQFFLSISNHLKCDRNIILLGDFNCVCAREDRVGSGTWNDKSVETLTHMLNESDVSDVAHCSGNTSTVCYTHFQGSIHARLDRIYVFLELLSTCNNYAVEQVSFTIIVLSPFF